MPLMPCGICLRRMGGLTGQHDKEGKTAVKQDCDAAARRVALARAHEVFTRTLSCLRESPGRACAEL